MPYWIGSLLSQLLQSAGVRVTVGVVFLAGSIYIFVLVSRYVAGLFERILATRDQERAAFAAQQNQVMAALFARVASEDKRRAEIEEATTKALVNIAATQERTANELGRFRDETGSKLGSIKSDLEFLKGRAN